MGEPAEADVASGAIDRWRRQFRKKPAAAGAVFEAAALEANAQQDDPKERIERAKAAMLRLIHDRFGDVPELIKQVETLAITGEEAVAILAEPARQPEKRHLAALEAVVAFDGTRPSFLVKDNQIDFTSSFNTGNWQKSLAPHTARLATLTACVGRVELDDEHIGTAFLVTPTLALTNRHVAQLIGKFGNDKMRLFPGVAVDFGREEWNKRASFDHREVKEIAFAGPEQIAPPIAHGKLDLAVLRLAPSALAGDLGQRHLSIGGFSGDDFDFARYAVAVGYPFKPDDFVPEALKTEFAKVLERLLEGAGGAKRVAPGVPDGVLAGPPPWTAKHDATTITGNSGSPLVLIKRGADPQPFRAAGLHYGGDWDGGRVNWAHLLALAGDTVGYGGPQTFAEFCKAEGIATG